MIMFIQEKIDDEWKTIVPMQFVETAIVLWYLTEQNRDSCYGAISEEVTYVGRDSEKN